MHTSEIDYDLPDSAIAQSAIEPRDSSRLLVVDGLLDRRFRDLPTILRPGDLVVVNSSRVRSARLIGRRRPGNGKTEVLLTQRVDTERWRALVRPASKLSVGSIVDCGGLTITLLSNPDRGVATVNIASDGSVDSAVEDHGEVPLPPYFKGSLDDPERYQTIFADALGSSAAPTAALHFTENTLAALNEGDISVASVDLQVGLDTFRPMLDGTVEDHRIHTERIHVSEATVAAVESARERRGRVIAVGTTVARTLESVATGHGGIGAYDGPTSLFITPGYTAQVIDGLVTNFHAPRTTLLVLLAALMGDRWRDVYSYALGNGYRFLSFGDAMYVEVAR